MSWFWHARAPQPAAAEMTEPGGEAPVPARRTLTSHLLREIAYVVILGTPLVLFILVARPRSNAVRLLHSLAMIEVNHTTFNQVQSLAGKFGPYAACVGDNCLFQFQNAWLHRLHLAPLTQFSVMLQRGGSAADPGGGTVRAIDMAMLVSREPDSGAVGDPIASALVFDRAGSAMPYQATITFGADRRPLRTVVTLSPAASAGERARARAFNLQCITRLGGCKNSHELLQGIWRGAQRIESVRNVLPAPGR